MQYHLNGFKPGDPSVSPSVTRDDTSGIVDVLIVGSGPAGLTLAAQLAAFPDITTRIVERRAGPLEVGQADGIACRSIEMFEAFGFAEKVIKEGYWVNEVTFWRPCAVSNELTRADRIQDVEDGLSEMPHVILSQARIHDFYLETMRHSPTGLVPDYSCEVVAVTRPDDPSEPVNVILHHLATGKQESIRARHVVGCDGARSAIRKSIGQHLHGQSARQLWGVMDVLAVTDFPDIRLKAAIQSASEGSLLIIPREGGYLVRFYIELAALAADERAADRNVSAELLIAKAQAILAPHTLDVKEVAWWSAYEIGQRVCDGFDDSDGPATPPRVFIAGDACHTHSPKAGQGMNVSMADTFNLGWKLAAVLRGQATPRLLRTYSEERQAKAKELIDFDRDMARLFSTKPSTAAEAAQFQQYFKTHGRYTAGVETRYDASLITGNGEHQALASGYPVGKRFHSAPVTRAADGKPLHLGHVIKADGRWRLFVFAPADGPANADFAALFSYLSSAPDSPVRKYTPTKQDIDSVFDVRAIFQTAHKDLNGADLPMLLRPTKGRYGLIDYEKAFCPAVKGPDIFDHRGIDRERGALIIVRPDQYVAEVLPLEAVTALSSYFDRFMLAPQRYD
ncbi:MAG: FAD-dependent monooxygenase [Pikeienuella sp.]